MHLILLIVLSNFQALHFQSQNTAMEASDERFLSASLELLHHSQENLTCQSAEDGRTATCVFKTSLQDFSFSLSVELEQADIQQVCNVHSLFKEIYKMGNFVPSSPTS